MRREKGREGKAEKKGRKEETSLLENDQRDSKKKKKIIEAMRKFGRRGREERVGIKVEGRKAGYREE